MKSLYPIKKYNDKLGKPLYKFARKIGLPIGIGYHAAHLPGSLLHAVLPLLDNPLDERNLYSGLSAFIISHCIFPKILEQNHEDNVRNRTKKLERIL